jgi:effector-binding domain-containing protein
LLPAGQYAVVTHAGPFGQLAEAVRNLLNWAAERGLAWDKPRAVFRADQ